MAAQCEQLTELDGRYSFDAWSAIPTCDAYTAMDDVCEAMAAASAQGVTMGWRP